MLFSIIVNDILVYAAIFIFAPLTKKKTTNCKQKCNCLLRSCVLYPQFKIQKIRRSKIIFYTYKYAYRKKCQQNNTGDELLQKIVKIPISSW